MRWRALLPLPILLAGCFVEVERRACFVDGEAFLDPTLRPTDAMRLDPAIAWSAVSDVCCDPGESGAGDQTCAAYFADAGIYPEQLWQLAACAPEGYCYLDCRPGENCACLSAADCAGAACRLLDRQGADGAACAAQGQTGAGRRCSACVPAD